MEDASAVGGRRLQRRYEPHRLSEEWCRAAYELIWIWTRQPPSQQPERAAVGEDRSQEALARRA